MDALNAVECGIIEALLERRGDLQVCAEGLLRLHTALVACYDHGGTLFTCGNGGSCADAMHIAGELIKSFERKRPLAASTIQGLDELPYGAELIAHLESGLRAITLGLNGSLKTAVENDSPLRDMAFAQELHALAKPGDVLLAISTGGNAANCLMAMAVGKAIGATTVALTGPRGGRMAAFADIAILAPGDSTKAIQEAHLPLYHTACALIEAHYFPEPR